MYSYHRWLDIGVLLGQVVGTEGHQVSMRAEKLSRIGRYVAASDSMFALECPAWSVLPLQRRTAHLKITRLDLDTLLPACLVRGSQESDIHYQVRSL